jgi:hypothetical protein
MPRSIVPTARTPHVSIPAPIDATPGSKSYLALRKLALAVWDRCCFEV